MNASWVCNRLYRPKGIVRFIPCNLEVQAPDPPSSSKIRQLINTVPKEQLYKELNTVALNTGILIQYINQRPAAPKRPKARTLEKTAEELEREEKEAWDSIKW